MTGIRIYTRGNNGEQPPMTIGQRHRRDGSAVLPMQSDYERLSLKAIAGLAVVPVTICSIVFSIMGWI